MLAHQKLVRFLASEPDYSDLKDIQGSLLLLFVFLVFVVGACGIRRRDLFPWLPHESYFQDLGRRSKSLGGKSIVVECSVWLGDTQNKEFSGWVQEGFSGFLLGILFLATKTKSRCSYCCAWSIEHACVCAYIFLAYIQE